MSSWSRFVPNLPGNVVRFRQSQRKFERREGMSDEEEAPEEHSLLMGHEIERGVQFVERVTIVEEAGDNDSGISEVGGEDHPTSPPGRRVEGVCAILTQVTIPFVIAGFGMMAAGLLLDAVQVSII